MLFQVDHLSADRTDFHPQANKLLQQQFLPAIKFFPQVHIPREDLYTNRQSIHVHFFVEFLFLSAPNPD